MDKQKTISGFSKLSKLGKIRWLVEHFFTEPDVVMKELKSYWLSNEDHQKLLDGFSENTISNYPLPYSIAPNFVVNGTPYAVPLVTEESSVVAAASSAAKFWMDRGGFHAEVGEMIKTGQVHFYWDGPSDLLFDHMDILEQKLRADAADITANMEARGGGILTIELKHYPEIDRQYYQLFARFDTRDSMGANFINTVLESFAYTLTSYMERTDMLKDYMCEVIMSILSNYTPECLVRAEVRCAVSEFDGISTMYSGAAFAERFRRAVHIARMDPYRAATHNKGIFNGVDAVVMATGNDFRAIKACGHTHAAHDGQYRSLTRCTIEDGIFRFWIELPLAVGTVGGLTTLHPIAKRSLELLGQPKAEELMKIIASVGLAQNFGAVRSLVTTGIQQGHMKLHLLNILSSMSCTEAEKEAAARYFADKVVSYAGVRDFIASLRI